MFPCPDSGHWWPHPYNKQPTLTGHGKTVLLETDPWQTHSRRLKCRHNPWGTVGLLGVLVSPMRLWPGYHFWAQSPELNKAALPSAPACGHIMLWYLASDSLLLPGELACDMGLCILTSSLARELQPCRLGLSTPLGFVGEEQRPHTAQRPGLSQARPVPPDEDHIV